MNETVYNLTVPWPEGKNDTIDMEPQPCMRETDYIFAQKAEIGFIPICTVPFMYTHRIVLSAKNLTFIAAPMGAFDDLKSISNGIWIGLGCVIVVLVAIDILHMIVMGTRKSVIAFVSQKFVQYFGAILGNGFDISSSLVIRFSVGPFLLIIVVLVNLFNGVLKANYSSQKRENINSVTDALRLSDDIPIRLQPGTITDDEVCRRTETAMKRLCDRVWGQKHEFPDKEKLSSGEEVWFADISVLQISSIYSKILNKPILLDLHLGSDKYFEKPMVFLAKWPMNPEALKYINRRLRAFLETGQLTPWLRSLKRDYHIVYEHSENENEVHVLKFKDIAAKLSMWAAMLGVASFVFTMEMLIMFMFH